MGTLEQGKLHIGEKLVNNQGLTYEIVGWENNKKVTVKFSDDMIKENCRYMDLKRGICPHPTFNRHIGEKYVNTQGLEFEIVEWISWDNVTIQFADGFIKKKNQYSNIKKGCCMHPKINPHIGEEYSNNQGYNYKIVDYQDFYNVTVEFSDGAIKEGCQYGAIKSGICPHPTKENILHIGEKFINTQGLEYEIIKWISWNNVTVKFSDGAIKKDCFYGQVKNNSCPHPTFIHNKVSKYAGFLTEPRAFEKNGNSYYPCICQKCNYRDILTPQEMVEHKNKCKDK